MMPLNSIICGDTIVDLYTEGATRSVRVNNQCYSDLKEVVKAHPDLSQHALTFARLSNFLATGFEFLPVLDPDTFTRQYRERIQFEKNNPTDVLLASSDFGVADISPVSSPRLAGGRLVYYVENRATHVPYEVSVGLDGSNIHYTPLPAR